MSDLEPYNQNDFMKEKIKERPLNKKKLLKKTLITAAMAVIFGLIACLTFLGLQPVFTNWLHPQEKAPVLYFPEDSDEMSPQDMISDGNQNYLGNALDSLEKDQVGSILSEMNLNVKDVAKFYKALNQYTNEMMPSIVTVTGSNSMKDWFSTVSVSQQESYGILISRNGKLLYILIDYTPLQKAEKLTASFYNGIVVNAEFLDIDPITNLAILAADVDGYSSEYLDKTLRYAEWGTSGLKRMEGTPVIALGNPMGIGDSRGYGIITASGGQWNATDENFKLMQTDIIGGTNGTGVLFNLQGQVVGIITGHSTSLEMKNMVTAYGITDLKKRIEKIYAGEKIPYLGIRGKTITEPVYEELNIPYGAYITEVEMDSPAMRAGIQQGDIITSLNYKSVQSFEEYTIVLMQMAAGQRSRVSLMRQVQGEYTTMDFDIELGSVE